MNKRTVLITTVPTEDTHKATYEIAAFKLLIQRFRLDNIAIPKRITKFYSHVIGHPGGPYLLEGNERKATIKDIRYFNKLLTARLNKIDSDQFMKGIESNQ